MSANRILVTGGAGFIGSALVRRLIAETPHTVCNLDALTYAAAPGALAEVDGSPRYRFAQDDVRDGGALAWLLADFRPDAVVHLAAETHVDRSIDDPRPFTETNVLGTLSLLEAARAYWSALDVAARQKFRIVHVSTDEVFGALEPGEAPFTGTSRYAPRSPYAASKAGADHLARAWYSTYGLPVMVTHAANTYGRFQYPEKLVPLMTMRALAGDTLPVYGDGRQRREWLHVDDHAAGLVAVLERGMPGATYCMAGADEHANIDVVHAIADRVDALASPLSSGPRKNLIRFVADRPGHDFRYAMDGAETQRVLSWRPERAFAEGLAETVAWYCANAARWGEEAVARRGLPLHAN